MASQFRPVIGITADNLDNKRGSGRYDVGVGYSRAVSDAGGVPVMLGHEADRVADFVALCDGFVFTGGVDPDTAAFGEPTHTRARIMDPTRQAFELALFDEIDRAKPDAAVLGVCLGMQFMALRAGGRLDQFMPDSQPLDVVERHRKSEHRVEVEADGAPLPRGAAVVHSHHQQAISDPGSLRVLARSEDRLIEAVYDPERAFYVGVQWHPERAPGQDAGPLNLGLFRLLVSAAGRPASRRSSVDR